MYREDARPRSDVTSHEQPETCLRLRRLRFALQHDSTIDPPLVELADDKVEEMDLPGRLSAPFQLDDFAGECAGEKQLVLAPADTAVAIDIDLPPENWTKH